MILCAISFGKLLNNFNNKMKFVSRGSKVSIQQLK